MAKSNNYIITNQKKNNNNNNIMIPIINWENHVKLCVDPRFSRAFPLDSTTRFFIYIGENLIFWKNTWSRHLFLFYFLRRKQNKKENPKCDSLFGKNSLWKTKVRSRGQVTYWEGTVVSHSTPLLLKAPTLQIFLSIFSFFPLSLPPIPLLPHSPLQLAQKKSPSQPPPWRGGGVFLEPVPCM